MIPLISQVPANDPISKRIIIAGVVFAIPLLIPFIISPHLDPYFNPKSAAINPERIKAN